MKNIDKIRQMNSNELAELFCCVDYTDCHECLAYDYCSGADTEDACKETFKQWLEQGVESR